jgi:hypothetical protein
LAVILINNQYQLLILKQDDFFAAWEFNFSHDMTGLRKLPRLTVMATDILGDGCYVNC